MSEKTGFKSSEKKNKRLAGILWHRYVGKYCTLNNRLL